MNFQLPSMTNLDLLITNHNMNMKIEIATVVIKQ